MPKSLLTICIFELLLLAFNACSAPLYEDGGWKFVVPIVDLSIVALVISLFFRLPFSYFFVSVYSLVGTIMGFLYFILVLLDPPYFNVGTAILPLIESITLLFLFIALHNNSSKNWFLTDF